MGGPERALTQEIEATTPRRTTVLYARVNGRDRPRGDALRKRVRCVAALSQAAALSGGRVLRKQPDAVMAVFASADGATAAAARMQAFAESGGHKSADMHVGIGYQTGAVTQQGRDIAGDTVALARELSRQARDGQILTSAETASALSAGVRIAIRPWPSAGLIGAEQLREVDWRESSDRLVAAQRSAAALAQPALRLNYQGKVLIRRRDSEFVTLGRDPSLDVVIDEPAASRRHCHIVRRDGRFILRDHSTNGTYVTIDGEGEVHLHVEAMVLRKAGWISLGLSGDATDHVVYFCCE
jgi:class 3 adenylate cyclase